MSYLFNTFFYNPLYNALVFLVGVIPGHDAGVAIILLTFLVSLLLFSISKKAIRSQIKLKEIEPELNRIKAEIKDKQEQAKAMLALYQKNHINPFSMFILILIQLPILFALYYVFLRGGLPSIHTELLYSFVHTPVAVNMNFLGILDISQKSLVVALIAGVTQFIQAQVAGISHKNKPQAPKGTFASDFSSSMQMQMKYVFPVIIIFIAMRFPSALPLYWSARNIFTICQELVVKRSMKNK